MTERHRASARPPWENARRSRRRRLLASLSISALAVSAAAAGSSVPVTVERRVVVMATVLAISVEANDRTAALAASEAAVRALEAAEDRLTTWRPSELGAFNAAAVNAEVELSPALARDLEAARRCFAKTGRAFDPGIGALVDAWGLRSEWRLPSRAERRRAAAAGGNDSWRLHGRRAARLHAGLRIEEGGFGKGAGLDDALAALAAAPGVVAAELDLGGQWGGLGRARRVTVSHPDRRTQPVVELELEAGSFSTSGNSERAVAIAGRRRGHLLDPRSGQPARDFGSVSVWSHSALEADCLSTGLYVLGPKRALRWAREHPEVEVLVLRRNGERLVAEATSGLRDRLKVIDPGVEVLIR